MVSSSLDLMGTKSTVLLRSFFKCSGYNHGNDSDATKKLIRFDLCRFYEYHLENKMEGLHLAQRASVQSSLRYRIK